MNLADKSLKRESAVAAFVLLVWLIVKSATFHSDQPNTTNEALETLRAALPFLSGLVAWGVGWGAWMQSRKPE